jgi:hypothetical protein
MGQQIDTKERLWERVDNDLTLHPPQNQDVIDRMEKVRAAAKVFAQEIIQQGTVPSREVSTALTRVEEALFNATASIARYQ